MIPSARTLPEALVQSAESEKPDQGFTFISENGRDRTSYSFADIEEHSRQYANGMFNLGIASKERVILILPNDESFAFCFLGALSAGVVPVPISPPYSFGGLDLYLSNLSHIMKASKASAIITSAQMKPHVEKTLKEENLPVHLVEELANSSTEVVSIPPKPDDLAFIQFTSGSTAKPKGAAISHGNLVANLKGIFSDKIPLKEDDVFCSWLPLFHDMGLTSMLAPILWTTPLVLASPMLFIKHPASWLQMITAARGTISFSPNFAYGLCVKRVSEKQLQELNLSSWRVAACAAEPINADTLEAFFRKFAAVGFKASSFLACYGLAESTVGVTFTKPGTGINAFTADLETLARQGKAVSPESTEHSSIKLINCGTALSGHQVIVVDENKTKLPENHVGEVLTKGPSVMAGYFGNEEATKETIRDGWLHTGDLGFFHEDGLYLCGRKKELIIVSGKNYYPADIEWAAAEVKGIRVGNVIAFSAGGFAEAEEQVTVCAETKENESEFPRLEREIVARVLAVLGIKVAKIVLLPPGSLPKTSSGKLQRTKVKRMYLEKLDEKVI